MKSSKRPSSLFNCHLFLVIFTFILIINGTSGLHLTGVTVLPDHPRADSLSGFFTHLLDEVAQMGNFSYNLRVMPPNTKAGGAVSEGLSPEGLVGEVYYDKADFVIADLEVTSHRESLLEFTRPFLRAKLAALVSRSRPQSLTQSDSLSFGENSDREGKGDGQHSGRETLRSVLLNSKRVVVRGSVVEDFFRMTTEQRVFRLMPTAVSSLKDALALLANDTSYAIVGDSARLGLLAAHDCQVEVITPKLEVITSGGESSSTTSAVSAEIGTEYSVDFAVGFHGHTAGFHQFNIALEELEVAGRLAELVETYWSGPCSRISRDEANTGGVRFYSGQDGLGSSGFPDDDLQENQGVVHTQSGGLAFWWLVVGVILPVVLLFL